MAAEQEKRHRIDHWLKLCCIYKQRSEATKACEGGKVRLNDRRAKPSAEVRVGDVIEIEGTRSRKLVVLDLPSGNVSKEQAREMYRDESPPPPEKTPANDDWFAAAMAKAPRREKGAGRPTKKDRRQLNEEGFRRG